MAIPSRQIGWGTEDNLLWQISKQLERLTQVTGNSVSPTLSQTLTQTLVIGNNTGGENIFINNADAIELENTSSLKKGTYNFGFNGGISRICSNNYEDMWQNGFRHVFDQSGFIRNSTNCFNIVPDASFDDTLRFKIGSFWTLDDGTTYECTDSTTGAAVWELYFTPPKYKVFTALLTQSGGDDPQSQLSGAVQKGVTYFVDGGTIGVTDFSNVGGQFQTPETGSYYFVATINGLPNEYGGASVDYNTGAPVVNVLENTIGNIWFTYDSIGIYKTKSDGLFINNKVWSTPYNFVDNSGDYGQGVRMLYQDSSNIYILTNDIGLSSADDILSNTPIEIRVYN